MEIQVIRQRLDEIDNEIIKLFKERMALSLEAAKYKEENNIPVLDAKREEVVLERVSFLAGELGENVVNLYKSIFAESRSCQQKYLDEKNRLGLLGEGIANSFSPLIHNELKKCDYTLFDMCPEDALLFLQSRKFKGLNVTIPYKKWILPFCTELSPRAREIGAVNTLKALPHGGLFGDNTDCMGILYICQSMSYSLKNKKVVILGTGGTALTAEYVAKHEGACEIVKISRQGENNYENISRHADADVVINTTPVGMFPACGDSPVDLKIFEKLSLVIDVIYNPLRTRLIQDAKALKIPCCGGLKMLVAQAAYSSEIFFGEEMAKSEIERIERKLLKGLANIVLIGMPGAGKSTLGGLLAKRTGRSFVDTDVLVEEMAGKKIPLIFEEDGENAFRLLEDKAIAEVSKRKGIIISVGGGAIINPANGGALRANGKICYVKRAIAKLTTEGRPLSKDLDALEKIFKQREEKYVSLGDFSVKNSGNMYSVANDILEGFYVHLCD
ncbi:MAG: shikimate kinase [Oscillospiraceae bacterium]